MIDPVYALSAITESTGEQGSRAIYAEDCALHGYQLDTLHLWRG